MKKDIALLVIDMQVCNFEDLEPVYRGSKLLERISELITQAHKARVPVIYIQNCGPEGEIDQLGTPGWEIHPSITPSQSDIIIQKHHPDAFHDTNLQNKLISLGIKRLVVSGIQTEYCVDTTCRSAYSLGYEVILVKDAHSTWDREYITASQIIVHHNSVLGGWFVKLKETSEIKFNYISSDKD